MLDIRCLSFRSLFHCYSDCIIVNYKTAMLVVKLFIANK